MAYTDYNWIEDRLAIGGYVQPPDDDLPFDAILSMETHAPSGLGDLVRSGQVEYQWRSILDGVCYEEHDAIVRRFDDAAEQLHDWVEGDKRVLVHCYAGVSRSVTAVIWYLMRFRGMSWDEALDAIRRSRTVANPNIRFEIALRLAHGEDLSEEWIDRRIQAYCAAYLEVGIEIDPHAIWEALEDQGTARRSIAATG